MKPLVIKTDAGCWSVQLYKHVRSYKMPPPLPPQQIALSVDISHSQKKDCIFLTAKHKLMSDWSPNEDIGTNAEKAKHVCKEFFWAIDSE
jgi:hypothetical protein